MSKWLKRLIRGGNSTGHPNEAATPMETEDATVAANEPQLLHKETLELGVWGIAALDNVVYVALQSCANIKKYNLSKEGTLTAMEPLHIPDLSWAADIVVDTRLKRLYVSDRKYGATEWFLFTIELGAEATPPSIRPIKLDATPGGLSMASDLELLVVCEHKSESLRSLRFFRCVENGGDADGQSPPLVEVIEKRIPLGSTIGKFVAQARLIADSSTIVISQSHPGDKFYQISIINNSGALISTYGVSELNVPYTVLVDESGLVFANDCKNERVVVLELVDVGKQDNGDGTREHLEYRRDLISKKNCVVARIFRPRRICAIEGRPDLLLVGCGTRKNHAAVPDIGEVDAGSVSVWRVC